MSDRPILPDPPFGSAAAHESTAEGAALHTAPDDFVHHHPHVNYLSIFIALCVCTALSVVFDALPATKRVIAVLVLAVAVAKAQFVMRYFMHLKFEGLWKYVLLLPTAILACGLPLALAPDIALHYYTPEMDKQLAPTHTAELSGEMEAAEHNEQAPAGHGH